MPTAHDAPDSAEITLPQDDLATRKTLGHYELKRKLGQGGMGAVYLAIDPQLKRQVALKILPREKAANPQLVKRFKAEAQNASQLTHENIVSVYGAGEADGYLYIALEFVDGIDVHDLVERRGVLPVKRSIDIIKQVSRALQHALDQGIVHRDIKPANLLVRRDGVVKLADMGLARAVDETVETGLTRAGTTVGTVDYMSPEQARNSKAADVRSDMYSLGCTWYHMLTGTPPFSEGSLTNKLHAHAKQPTPDPRDKNSAVPEGVVAVMQRMMAKDPNDRYQTPMELIKDLEGALVNRDVVSRKILEAIDDDSVQGDESSFQDEISSGGSNPSPPPINMQWSDSVETITAEPLPPVDQGKGSARRAESGQSDSAEAEYEVRAPALPPKSLPPQSHPPQSLPPRTKPTGAAAAKGTAAAATHSKPGPAANAKSAPSPDSEPAVSHKTPVSNSKSPPPPAKTSVSFGRSGAGSGKSPNPAGQGSSRTMPPPNRKDAGEAGEQPTSPFPSQLKTLLTALGIVSALGVIVFLANLAQQLGGAAAPTNVVNPFEGQLPPAPIQPNTVQQVPEAGSETAEVGKPADKDVLVESGDPPAATSDANSTANNVPRVEGVLAGVGVKDYQESIAGTGDLDKTVPAWVRENLLPNSVPLFGVRAGASVEAERHYGSLAEAFQKLTPAGARIILYQDGPFDLTPVEIAGGIVTLEAAPGTRPRIRLVAHGEHRKLPWLSMTRGTLILDGVDIVGDAATVPAADPWSWVRVTNGHLYVHRSSFTLTGKRTGPTTALKIVGPLADKSHPEITQPRFLLDQSVVRGDGLQAIQLECPGFEAVVRNSLLVAGDAAAVSLRGAEKADPALSRQLRFVTTTVCSNQRALYLSSQGTTNPIQTDLIALGTLFAAPAEASQPVLLFLEDWPANKNRAAQDSAHKNLTWTAAGSAVLGFNPLLKSGLNDAAPIADGPTWRKSFKAEAPMTFSLLTWPADIQGGVAAAPLKSWSLKSLESLPLTFPIAGVTPGCPVSGLRSADFSPDAKSAVTRAQRLVPPPRFAAKTFVQVDLNRTDLGKFIATKDWEDGTVFVASGSGPRYCSAIAVEKHRWRVQFRQTSGPPLVIIPRGPARGIGDSAAFITIRGGQFDIEQGSFNMDAKDAQSITPWFIFAEGGGFALQHCRVVVPPVAANRNRGIIRWSAAAGSPMAGANEGEIANYGQISDSLLVGNGTLISADMSRRALVLINSALVGRQHLFELRVGGNQGRDAATFDAQDCTYLAGGTQFAVQSQSAAGDAPRPLRIFHVNCVFGVLPRDASQARAAPLLMNYTGGAELTKQVQWYEESCGQAPELKTYLSYESALPTAALAAQDFPTDWVKRWGADRVQRPLLGADGVVFEKGLASSVTTVKPENLAIHKTAKARTWSESGGTIGVRPGILEPPPAPAPPRPVGKRPTPKAPPGVKF